MLENTTKNKTILTGVIIVGVALIAGQMVSKENRPYLWAAGAVIGFMASSAFVPVFLKPIPEKQ